MSSTELDRSTSLLARPHHDGSPDYVLEQPDELGGDAVLRVRVPKGADGAPAVPIEISPLVEPDAARLRTLVPPKAAFDAPLYLGDE